MTPIPGPGEMRRALKVLADGYEALWALAQSPPAPPVAPEAAERRMLDYRRMAEYLGVGLSKAKQLAAAGEIPKTKIASRVLFDKLDVDAYVDRIKGTS